MTEARDNLLRTIGPALSYVQSKAAGADALSLDFEAGRRQFIERISGERAPGVPSSTSPTLDGGMAPSLARVEQWSSALTQLVKELREHPERFGVRLIDYEEV